MAVAQSTPGRATRGDVAGPGLPPPPRRWSLARADGHDHPAVRHGRNVLYILLLVVVAVVVLFPVVVILIFSFIEGRVGQLQGFGLEHWVAGMSHPRIPSALWNTITLSVTRQGIAMVVGILIAWLIAKTDLPFGKTLEFGFWVAFFVPSLTITLSWIFLMDPYTGVLNRMLAWLPFVGDGPGPLNVFSWWGIIWVNLAASALPVKVMLLTPAFRALDSSLEEVARTSGDTAMGALRRVTVPILMPTFIVVAVLGVIRSFESFEVELILGTPAGIEVLSSLVYSLARVSVPPNYGAATVTSMISILIMLPAVLVQQRYGSRRSVATVTGKFRNEPRKLGRWRWPLFTVVLILVCFLTIIPVIALVGGSFMRFFGIFEAREPWTTMHWSTILGSTLLTRALRNSINLSALATLLVLTWFVAMAYLVVRSRYRGRATLDFMAWLPTIVPGVVLGLGYLWLFLLVPGMRQIYGTIWSLVLVAALGSMTVTVQLVKQGLRQLGSELEEASWASGAGRLTTLRRVVLPLLSPVLVVIAVTAFSTTARTTSHVALLTTSRNQPLSILQLIQMADGRYEAASVVGIFILFLTLGVAMLARAFGYKNY